MNYVSTDKNQAGFTLVELAIVMVIIGILLGGILNGQQLITSARVSATVTDLQAYGAAVMGFYNDYNAYPGDINDPDVLLAGCEANSFCAGAPDASATIGNSLVDDSEEQDRYFLHLARADLISAINGTADGNSPSPSWGDTFPSAPIGGGLVLSYTNGQDDIGAGAIDARDGHYLNLVVNSGDHRPDATGSPASGSFQLTPLVAMQIDSKYDDGRPATGLVIADGNSGAGANCMDATDSSGKYNGAEQSKQCNLFVRTMN